MAFSQSQSGAWENRYNADHFSYRDSQSGTALFLGAGVLGEAAELALLATQAALGVPGTVYYPFGYNARNNALTGNINRWPNLLDYGYPTQSLVPRGQCYARSVAITVDTDTFVRFISLNPLYTILLNQFYSVDLIESWGISSTITEVEQFIGGGNSMTLYPTYAVALAYRAQTANGTINIAIEGNVEGGE